MVSQPEVVLTAPLKWTAANQNELKMLQNLQGNILKGHGRNFTANIFFAFGAEKTPEARRLLRELANYHLTSAHRQLTDTQRFKKTGLGGGDFCHLALSFGGYAALGLTDKAPDDADFRAGMKDPSSLDALQDEIQKWEDEFTADIHAVLLAASETEAGAAALAARLRKQLIDAGCEIIHIQTGKAVFNAAGEGIEHFGYVDGRSQPLMLVEDIEAEAEAGLSRWDPAFPLNTALVKDPGVDDSLSFGSYFIFRKLEQRVRDFKTREQEIADRLQLAGEARELAGAMLVGRFEDGTPVTLSDEPRGLKPPNDFNYDGDPGSRCPFHGHIRKTNPRGTGGAEPEANERQHLMARRGIPFEDVKRPVHPSELPEIEDMAGFDRDVKPGLPEYGVGLLFMAYNADIGRQFKFTQKNWVNNAGFPFQPNGPHGMDPVIGQGPIAPNVQKLPKQWDRLDQGTEQDVDFGGFVIMRGGEYFFSPSLSFLKGL